MTVDVNDRLARQICFLVETEKLKGVLRKTSPIHVARYENSAEHSWTLALMAMLLAEHAVEELDAMRVIQMLLVHDLVEVDAGDTFCYDLASNETKAERERCAAERLFGLLPSDQEREFRQLWEEFEARASAEARFANALDRLMPLLQNFHNGGGSWREFGITVERALDRQRPIADASAALWEYAQSVFQEARQLKLFHVEENALEELPARASPRLPADEIR
ncbi:MAG TPA: HD domain-containing protein [Chthoniobacterales bacterium]|nr:HD domain-containing protein [Chthoniobacterales bacterium]